MDNKKKVLVACSGGPDSMALLDMYKDKYDCSVAHVNYHHRNSALRDENIVRDYCLKYNIPFYKKDYVESKGNFQEKAREFRYEFFKELCDKHNLSFVLVAHHKDDLIETYLFQKKRNSHVYYYGLKSNVNIYGVNVRRPLLSKTKKDLEEYCVSHNLEYGIDESNLGDEFSRNKIRHSVIDKMSIKEKNKLVREIRDVNRKNDLLNKECRTFINKRTKIDFDEFIKYPDLKRLIRMFVGISLSSKQSDELIRQLKSTNSFEILIEDRYLCKEYGYIEVYKKEDDYTYSFDSISCFKCKYFKLSKKGSSKEGVTLSENDFPITIRNFRDGDFILMRYGTKKISRFFIDNKISSRERKVWPIMFNKDGSAILVPKIGCNRHHYSIKHNLYMIKS